MVLALTPLGVDRGCGHAVGKLRSFRTSPVVRTRAFNALKCRAEQNSAPEGDSTPGEAWLGDEWWQAGGAQVEKGHPHQHPSSAPPLQARAAHRSL